MKLNVRYTVWKKVKPILILFVLIIALFLLFDALKNYHYKDLQSDLYTYSFGTLLLASLLTTANYFILTLYDVLAMHYIHKKLPYRQVGFASFESYVFSNNIGLSLFGSSTMRFRFYSAWGFDGGEIAKIVGFCVATFWIGLSVMGGLALSFSPVTIPSFHLLGRVTRFFGLFLLLVMSVYFTLVWKKRGKVCIVKAFSFSLPSPQIALSQFFISSLDWILAASVFYVLLPAGKPSFLSCVGIFVFCSINWSNQSCSWWHRGL